MYLKCFSVPIIQLSSLFIQPISVFYWNVYLHVMCSFLIFWFYTSGKCCLPFKNYIRFLFGYIELTDEIFGVVSQVYYCIFIPSTPIWFLLILLSLCWNSSSVHVCWTMFSLDLLKNIFIAVILNTLRVTTSVWSLSLALLIAVKWDIFLLIFMCL